MREYLLDRESALTYPLYCIVLIRLRFSLGTTIPGIRFHFWGQIGFRHMSNRFILSGLTLLLAGFTASCGFGSGNSGSNMPDASAQTPAQASDQTQTSNQSQNSGALVIPPPIAQPPNYESRPGADNTATQTMPNGLPALQPKGVNVNSMFAENLTDSNSRFNRLENAVTDLRREFESFKPAITRLVAVESDIQALIQQLDMLLQNEPAPMPPPAPVAAPSAPPQALIEQDAPAVVSKTTTVKTTTTTTTNGASVSELRVGQHSGKTRIVMDLSKKASLMADLDNAENLLVLELPDARWDAATQKSFSSSPLIRSYTVESINGGSGSRVIMALKKGTQILKQQDLPPGNNPNYRIYLDLSA